MKLPGLLFVILLAMCGVVGISLIIGETPSTETVSAETGQVVTTPLGHGITHPRFATMQSGGDGLARHQPVLWLGWAFAMLQVALFISLLACGGEKQGRLGPLKVPLLVGGMLYAAVFTALIYSYHQYMREDMHAMFLSLPIPTAWMIYGVWPIPVVFVFAYMLTFDRWVFRPEDKRRFEQLLAESGALINDTAEQQVAGKDVGGDRS